jgi:serine/threonine protein kinase
MGDVVPCSQRAALGKANVWLAKHVGDAVGAMKVALIQGDDRAIWRFEAFTTGVHFDPMDPIGQIEVDAETRQVLAALLQQALRRPAQPNLNIPDYEVERKLGEGGMGAVYLVRHKQTGKRAALKVMLAKVAVNERSRQDFMREIETTRALRHPHIVEFLDQGATGNAFYFLLEFCAGGSLADLLQRRSGRLPLAEAGPLMLQVLAGLAFAHERGFVHRDLKPQNILLTSQAKPWTAKVADLGLAKNFTQAGLSGMTATGSYGGTYPFMAREQLTNFKFAKPVTDVWAMGATLYVMLTGQYPRESRSPDPIMAILQGRIVPIRERDATIPKRVAEVIDRSFNVIKLAQRFITHWKAFRFDPFVSRKRTIRTDRFKGAGHLLPQQLKEGQRVS